MPLRRLTSLLAVLVLVAGSARAQGEPEPSGVRLTGGLGVEGFTGNLAEAFDIGPVASVAASVAPLPALSVELAYHVGLHQIETGRDGGLVDGYDIVRHGPQLALTLGPSLQGVRPYLLAGVGLSWTNVRGPDDARYRDDTDVYVPLGGGLSVSAGRISLDARLDYQALFDQESIDAPGGGDFGSGGRFQALVSLGLAL